MPSPRHDCSSSVASGPAANIGPSISRRVWWATCGSSVSMTGPSPSVGSENTTYSRLASRSCVSEYSTSSFHGISVLTVVASSVGCRPDCMQNCRPTSTLVGPHRRYVAEAVYSLGTSHVDGGPCAGQEGPSRRSAPGGLPAGGARPRVLDRRSPSAIRARRGDGRTPQVGHRRLRHDAPPPRRGRGQGLRRDLRHV